MITCKITKAQFEEISSAKTKHDMCYQMDRFRYRDLPWCFMSNLSKFFLLVEFENFLDILKSFVYEN